MYDFLKKWFPSVTETSDELNKYFNVTATVQVISCACLVLLTVRSFLTHKK